MPARLLEMAVIPSRSDLAHRKTGAFSLLVGGLASGAFADAGCATNPASSVLACSSTSVCYLSNNLRFPSSSLVVVFLWLDMEPSCAGVLICMFEEKMVCGALLGQSDDYEMQMPPV